MLPQPVFDLSAADVLGDVLVEMRKMDAAVTFLGVKRAVRLQPAARGVPIENECLTEFTGKHAIYVGLPTKR